LEALVGAFDDQLADSKLSPAIADFRELLGRSVQQAQLARLQELGLNTDSDLERTHRRIASGRLNAFWLVTSRT
jgi:hypothetical protein